MQPLAIKELGLDVPEPNDPEFVARVKALVSEADHAARALCDQPGRAPHRVGAPHKQHRRNDGRGCVGCGGPLDERTEGCSNCKSRHAMRALHERRRLS